MTDNETRGKETILVGTADAARVLQLAERTVRKHINAGKLTAHMINGAWLVEMPRDQVEEAGIPIPQTDPLDGEGVERPRLASTRAAGGPDTTLPAPVDLTPMAAMIADLTRQVGELSANAAMWQERARSLEVQNHEIRLALTAGENRIDATEVQRRIEEAASAAKEQGRVEGKAEALSEVDRRTWWQKLFG